MLKVDPAYRRTAKEILNHPWITVSSCLRINQIVAVFFIVKYFNLQSQTYVCMHIN